MAINLKALKPHKVVADLFNYKYVIAGRPKVGKTSLVYEIAKEKFDGDLSKLLLIALEKGYNTLDGVYAQDVNNWKEFKELVDELIENKGEISFRILAFDTVDMMVKYATEYILKTQSRKDNKIYSTITDLAYGRGYDLLENEISKQLHKLDKAGYTLFFITHDKDQKFKTREGFEYDKTTLSLGGRVRNAILNMVDFIVFIENGKEIEKGGAVDKRWIYFRGQSDLEAGTRFKHIPEKIEYSPIGFIQAVETAILKEYKNDKKALEKEKKEQNEKMEKEAKEFIEKQKELNGITVEELHKAIGEALKKLSNPEEQAEEIGAKFKEILGFMNYMKSDDKEALQEALKYVKGLK